MAGAVGRGAGGQPAAAVSGPAAARVAPACPRGPAAAERLYKNVARHDSDRRYAARNHPAPKATAGHTALSLRGVPGPGRYWRGVARLRHRPGARGGAEGAAEAGIRGWWGEGTVRGGGPPRQSARAPVDCAGARPRRTAGRAAVLRDETDPRPDLGGSARGTGITSGRPGAVGRCV